MGTIKKSMFAGVLNRMKSSFLPQVEEDARVAMNGAVVVKTNTNNGKEWVDKDATVYDESFIIDQIPVLTIAKTKGQVNVGDIVKLTGAGTFATVDSIDGDRIECTTFGGAKRVAKQWKDMFLGQATVKVVVNPLGNVDGNGVDLGSMLPLILLSEEKSSKDSFMDMIILSSVLGAQGKSGISGLGNNPMLLMAAMKDGSDSSSDLLTTMMMANMLGQGGVNPFSIFGAKPTAPVAPVAPAEEAPTAE